MPTNRRFDYRVPVDMFLTEYVDDRPRRAYASDVSEHGLHVARAVQPVLRLNPIVQLEFRLPGTSDTIWAAGRIRYDALDSYFHASGLWLYAIAQAQARWIRDYVMEARAERLRTLLERIRGRRQRMAGSAAA